MNTVDSRFYRKLLGALLSILAVTVLAAIICLFLFPALTGLVAVLGGASAIAVATALSHVRMRMMFSSMNSRSAKTMKELESTKTGFTNSLLELRSDLATQPWAEQFNLVDRLYGKVSDLEREVIANDSFADSRSDEIANLVIGEVKAARLEVVAAVESGFSSWSESELVRADSSQAVLNEIRESIKSNTLLIHNLREFAQTANKYLADNERLLRKHTSDEYDARRDHGRSLDSISRNIDGISDRLSSLRKRAGRMDEKIGSGFNSIESKISETTESEQSYIFAVGQAVDRVRSRLEEIARMNAENAELNALAVEEQFELVSKKLASRAEAGATLSALAGLSDEIHEIHRLNTVALDTSSTQLVDSVNRALNTKFERVEQGIETQSANIVNRLVASFEELGARSDSVEKSAQEHFNALQSKLQQLRVGVEELPKDVSDYSSLLGQYDLLSTESPRIGGWAVTVPAIASLVREIENRSEVENVLDVGSGTSTVWSALAMRKRGYGKVFALEHEPEYAEQLRSTLDELDLTDWAEVVVAPLAPWTPGRDYTIEPDRLPDRWYSTYDISDREFDVVFVDGPPGRFQEFSRLPAMESLINQLRLNCLVVIDDTIRVEERDTVNEWLSLDFEDRKLIIETQLSKSTVLRLVD